MKRAAMLFLAASLAGGVFSSSAAQGARSLDPVSLLVVNQGDASVSLVDTAARREVAQVVEGVPKMVGHEVAVSPDGKLAYVPLYGDSGVGKPGADGDQMLVIDIGSRKILSHFHFDEGVRPHCAVYDRKRHLLYVTTELKQAVTVIDPATMKVVGTIPTRQPESHMLAVSHDGHRGYTANVGPGTVSVLDMDKRSFVTTIPIGATTQRISISNDDQTVFTSDQTKPRLAMIDTKTNTVREWVELPSLGYGSASTPDGRWLLVTLPVSGGLAVVDLAQKKVARTIAIGVKPQEVVVQPDGQFAYVSCFGGHQVMTVDLKSWTVVGMTDVGQKADGMALVPTTGR